VVRHELFWIELAAHDRLKQQRRGHRVHEPRGDGDVLRPKFFEVQRHARAMYADVGDVAADTDDILAEPERGTKASVASISAGFGRSSTVFGPDRYKPKLS
jgi:hypothetical protein